jgi:hypothetical protein
MTDTAKSPFKNVAKWHSTVSGTLKPINSFIPSHKSFSPQGFRTETGFGDNQNRLTFAATMIPSLMTCVANVCFVLKILAATTICIVLSM